MNFQSKNILELWFSQNILYPYANKETKKELSDKTNLSVKQITQWLINQRKKIQKKKSKKRDQRLSTSQKLFLNEYFKNSSQKPDAEEILKISKKTGIDSKKIYFWFGTQRFKLKHINKKEDSC